MVLMLEIPLVEVGTCNRAFQPQLSKQSHCPLMQNQVLKESLSLKLSMSTEKLYSD